MFAFFSQNYPKLTQIPGTTTRWLHRIVTRAALWAFLT